MKPLILVFFALSSGCHDVHNDVDTSTVECGNPFFDHKSEELIRKMSTEEKMDRMVLEQMFHVPTSNDDNYELLHELIIEDGIRILPKAIEYVTSYDPYRKECRQRSDAQLLTAAIYLNNVDSAKVRIRATENGRVAIDALERAIERRRKFSQDSDLQDGRSNLLSTLLEAMKGWSIKDGLIKQTIERRHGITMSDAESKRFIDFLIVLDPNYPSWTKVIGWAEMTEAEATRYYQAYVKFKGVRQDAH